MSYKLFACMTTKKDIDIKKIQMTWEYAITEVDLHSRRYLQYFVMLWTFIFAVSLATVTGHCNIDVWVIIATPLVLISLYYIYRIKSFAEKLKKGHEGLLDKLDSLK